jgi:hypothetical protein
LFAAGCGSTSSNSSNETASTGNTIVAASNSAHDKNTPVTTQSAEIQASNDSAKEVAQHLIDVSPDGQGSTITIQAPEDGPASQVIEDQLKEQAQKFPDLTIIAGESNDQATQEIVDGLNYAGIFLNNENPETAAQNRITPDTEVKAGDTLSINYSPGYLDPAK